MKKWLLAFGILVLAWFGLKDIAYTKYLTSGPAILPPPLSYAEQDSWAKWPAVQPDGAWVTPWGIDAFVVLPTPPIAHKHGLIPADDETALELSRAAMDAVTQALPADMPIYAPFYRGPSPANSGEVARQMKLLTEQDLTSAFDTYMSAVNQGRGVLLIVVEPAGDHSHDLLGRLQAEDMADRFAGMISLQAENADLPQRTLSCSPALEGACHQQIEMQVKSSFASMVLPSVDMQGVMVEVYDAPGVAEAIKVQAGAVSTWLDENAPKPAEPFGFSNVIEAAPIYRPGEDAPIDETDE